MLFNSDWKFGLLTYGDEIAPGDEYYQPKTDSWLPVETDTIGDVWEDDVYKPVRRSADRIELNHSST